MRVESWELRVKVLATLIITLSLVTCLLSPCYARATVEGLPDVEKLFLQAKYDRVVTEADKLIAGGAAGREELNYLKGLSLLQLSRFREARQVFEHMTERYPRGKKAFDAYIGIGDSYYMEGKYNDSVVAYNGALKAFPDHKNSAAAYYKIGKSYQKLGIKDKANEYYGKVKAVSPLSFESRMLNQEPGISASIPAPETEKSDDEGYYYVQVGSFKAKSNADKLSEGLKRKGYESSIATVLRSNSAFYRVKVGRYKTKAEAEAEAKKLKKDGFVTKVCP